MKIHIGCGPRNFGPDWIHIDGESFEHVTSSDYLLRGYEQNSIDLIYASHFLEYFDRGEALVLLSRWNILLKEGGILRLSVPNFRILSLIYRDYHDLDGIIGPLYGRMNMNGKYIYHKTVYDFPSLKELLLLAGFSSVREYDWRKTEHAHIDDHSRAHYPHDPEAIRTGNFTEKHTLISLNLEAIK